MSDSSSGIGAAITANSPRRIRLSIAHLFLWMATTGAVLALMRGCEPPAAERIGFGGSFLHRAGMTQEEVKAAMRKEGQKIWLRWHRQYLIGLAFAPIYGAAGAGVVLAAWRVVTRRFGFPTQPGHWLLLVIAAHAGLLYAQPFLQQSSFLRNSPIGQEAPDFVIALAMTGVAATATFFLSQPVYWRLAFIVLLVAQAIASLAFASYAIRPTPEPPFLLGLGLLLDLAFAFIALGCAVADIAEREHYDVFHWIGVATLLGVLAHCFALGLPRFA